MDNVNRLAVSSARLALPSFNQHELLECIKELVRVDSDYIPTGKGYSLYLRPTFIGTTVRTRFLLLLLLLLVLL